MSTPSNFNTCECTGPGFCQRHGINKNATWVRLCKISKSYWDAWERGQGPGQLPVVARQAEIIYSGIGDILARRFSSLGIVPVPGCPCKDVQRKLNSMPVSSVESNLEGLAKDLQRSAKKWKELKGGVWNFIPTPPLWLCRRVIEDACKEVKGQLSSEDLTDTTPTI